MSLLKLVGVLLDYPQDALWQHGDELLAAAGDPGLPQARRAALAGFVRELLASDLRKTLLLCQELGLLQDGQYRHVSQIVANIGNRLGSWRNPEKEKSAQPKHRIADAGAGPG